MFAGNFATNFAKKKMGSVFSVSSSNDSLGEEIDDSPSTSPRPTQQREKKEDDSKLEVEDHKLNACAVIDDVSLPSPSTSSGGFQQHQLLQQHQQQQQQTPCPVPDCDSRGHLSGMYERHSSKIGCPIYHNTTPEDCVVKCRERREREEKRKQALDVDKYVGRGSRLWRGCPNVCLLIPP